MALFTQVMCNPAQVTKLWAASMAAQTMVQQPGGGQSIQPQGGRQTAQLAGSKTGRHESAAGAPDEAPKSPNRRGKKKQKVMIHPTSVTILRQIRALRVSGALDGYQCAAGSIFQRTASAEPDLPFADCDPVPSLVESSDSESDVDEDEDPQNNVSSLFHVLPHVCFHVARFPALGKKTNGCVDHRLAKLFAFLAQHPECLELMEKLRSVATTIHKSSQVMDHFKSVASSSGKTGTRSNPW